MRKTLICHKGFQRSLEFRNLRHERTPNETQENLSLQTSAKPIPMLTTYFCQITQQPRCLTTKTKRVEASLGIFLLFTSIFINKFLNYINVCVENVSHFPFEFMSNNAFVISDEMSVLLTQSLSTSCHVEF